MIQGCPSASLAKESNHTTFRGPLCFRLAPIEFSHRIRLLTPETDNWPLSLHFPQISISNPLSPSSCLSWILRKRYVRGSWTQEVLRRIVASSDLRLSFALSWLCKIERSRSGFRKYSLKAQRNLYASSVVTSPKILLKSLPHVRTAASAVRTQHSLS